MTFGACARKSCSLCSCSLCSCSLYGARAWWVVTGSTGSDPTSLHSLSLGRGCPEGLVTVNRSTVRRVLINLRGMGVVSADRHVGFEPTNPEGFSTKVIDLRSAHPLMHCLVVCVVPFLCCPSDSRCLGHGGERPETYQLPVVAYIGLPASMFRLVYTKNS